MAQYLLPGYGDIDETVSAQLLLPGSGDLNETTAGDSDATVALTGQAATASAGSLTPSTAKVLSGSAATASAGTVIPALSIAQSGQSMTASQGTMSVAGDVTAALSGLSMTTAQGLMTRLAEVSEVSGGSFYEAPRIERNRTVQQERERLGIITKQIKKVLIAIAKASVDREATDTQAGGLLASALAMHGLQTAPQYEQFMQQERDRILSRDIERALRIRQRQYELDEDEREAEMLLM